jgi:hypothetical protein
LKHRNKINVLSRNQQKITSLKVCGMYLQLIDKSLLLCLTRIRIKNFSNYVFHINNT